MAPSLGNNAIRGLQGFHILMALSRADSLTVLQRDKNTLDLVLAALAIKSNGV